MKTVRGIYHRLEESEYSFKYDDLTFVFSSKLYLKKFMGIYKEYLKERTARIESEFKSTVYADELILIQLYRKIEKRGFRVLYFDKPLDEKLYYNVELEV